MTAMIMAKKRTTNGRGRKPRRSVHVQRRAEKRTTVRRKPRPKIPEKVIRKFGDLLGNPQRANRSTQQVDRLRDSLSSDMLAQRIMADIEVLARRASHAKKGQAAVPQPTAPHPPDYKLHLMVEAPLTTIRDRWDRPHLRYAIWFHRGLAALRLAEIGTDLARRLELLTDQQPQRMISVAHHMSEWPVNLRLEKADKNGKRDLLGSEAAKLYLSALQLNALSFAPCDASPFAISLGVPKPARVAAERLVTYLCWLRGHPHKWLSINTAGASGGRIPIVDSSRWVRSLMKLKDPITNLNVSDWWKVAQDLLSEAWRLNPTAFKPLSDLRKAWAYPDGIESAYTSSNLRSRVINDDLKKAFCSLAIHAV